MPRRGDYLWTWTGCNIGFLVFRVVQRVLEQMRAAVCHALYMAVCIHLLGSPEKCCLCAALQMPVQALRGSHCWRLRASLCALPLVVWLLAQAKCRRPPASFMLPDRPSGTLACVWVGTTLRPLLPTGAHRHLHHRICRPLFTLFPPACHRRVSTGIPVAIRTRCITRW